MKNMKSTYKPILTAALAFVSTVPAIAQTEGEDEANQQKQVNAAFRQIAADDLMGGYSTVDVEELMKKNNITYSLDNMQGYVGGWNGTGMWGIDGGDILYLIDGVPRDQTNVKPDEIQEITFMKGAQAVILYGSRAAKGAVLITTKRGKQEDLHINVKANTGMHVAKVYPEYLHSAEYMSFYNEALANDGQSPKYSQADIYNYASKQNPYRYSDVNFYSSDYIKKAYNRTDVVAEVTGGNKLATFYSNIGYYRQGDYLDFGTAKNNYIDRFDVRGNVDLHLSDYVSGFVNATATYYNSKSAINLDDKNFWQHAETFRPNRMSPLVPIDAIDPNARPALDLIGASSNIIDGKYFLAASEADQTNIFANYYAAGKSTWTSRQFQFDAGVNIDLQKVLKGLSFHTQISIDYATSYSQSYNNTYATYNPAWSNANGQGAIIGLTKYNEDKRSGVQNIGGSKDNQTIAFNAHFDYKRTFNDDHNVDAILVANGFTQTFSGEYHKTANANLGLNVAYNYQHKYFAEAAISVVHSARLPKNNRQGLSQSYTLGWNVLSSPNSVFDYFRVSASASDLKTDIGMNYYEYLGYYQSGGWWDWGGTGVTGTQAKSGPNSALDFIDRKEVSVNLKGSMFNKSVWFDLSYFTNSIEGQLIDGTNYVPNYFITYYPESNFSSRINFNNDRRSGVDFSVNGKTKIGDFALQGGVNLTYYTSEMSKRDDTTVADEYQKKQGRYIDGIWGYQCLGFFKSQEEIDNSPVQKVGDAPRVGDLKYVDQNEDGVIDSKDQVQLGKGGGYWDSNLSKYVSTGSPLIVGVNLTAQYKNFTLFVLGTGNFGSKAVKNNSYWWSGASENKYTAVVRDRAIVKDGKITNLESAKYPALTTGSGSNNFQTSDFWMYSTDQFNLSKVQLTYDFAQSLFENSKAIKGVSVYVSGTDLLKIARNREILEMNVGSAPQSRFYNLGVKVQF